MKKVIGRKRYDTETAERVHRWTNGHYTSDFNFRSKTLYKTRKGAWFLHHEGGALSDMARQVGNGYGWGESIEPLKAEEAVAFLEDHGGEEALEEHFPEAVADA